MSIYTSKPRMVVLLYVLLMKTAATAGNGVAIQHVYVPAWHRHANSIVPPMLDFAFCNGAEAGMMTMAADGCAETNSSNEQTASTLQTDIACMKEITSALVPGSLL